MDEQPDNPPTSRTAPIPPGPQEPKAMDKHGPIGKQFTEEGAIGGTAEKIGGPLSKEGAIGKQFTTEGSIGGTVQSKMGGTKGTKES